MHEPLPDSKEPRVRGPPHPVAPRTHNGEPHKSPPKLTPEQLLKQKLGGRKGNGTPHFGMGGTGILRVTCPLGETPGHALVLAQDTQIRPVTRWRAPPGQTVLLQPACLAAGAR